MSLRSESNPIRSFWSGIIWEHEFIIDLQWQGKKKEIYFEFIEVYFEKGRWLDMMPYNCLFGVFFTSGGLTSLSSLGEKNKTISFPYARFTCLMVFNFLKHL